LDSVCKGVPDPIRAFAAYRKGDVAIAFVHEPDYFSTRSSSHLSTYSFPVTAMVAKFEFRHWAP
jgi:hypothetical protein